MGDNFCGDLQVKLNRYHYETPDPVKVSTLIADSNPGRVPSVQSVGSKVGPQRLARAGTLQDLGDHMRKADPAILASLAVGEIIKLRGGPPTQQEMRAFIIDSLKHRAEIELLRLVYGHNFRLIAIHCSRDNRFSRLENGKFHLAPHDDIGKFIDRDEQDRSKTWGQEVNQVFHQADFFVDNDHPQDNVKYGPDLDRFVDLCVGGKLLRPTIEETGMYHAHAASMRSACLSRQVGAAILSRDGRVLAIGANEVPKSGGGVYCDGDKIDKRCFKWTEWCLNPKDEKWGKIYGKSPVGPAHCHNTRRKHELRSDIVSWFVDDVAPQLADNLLETTGNAKELFAQFKRQEIVDTIKRFFGDSERFKGMPGVKDLIEYSRSIHAEMEALMSALRSGTPTIGAVLYTTTYPCHNCARHIVAAGISRVYYMEPFVKSLAIELHHDALIHDNSPECDGNFGDNRVAILPFTGVGPRLYAELFTKVKEWKGPTGEFVPPPSSGLPCAIQLDSLEAIERRAAERARILQPQERQ